MHVFFFFLTFGISDGMFVNRLFCLLLLLDVGLV